MRVLNINISKLCQYTNYESSAIFRIRNGSRNPSDPVKFASDIAGLIAREMNTESDKKLISKLTGCNPEDISDSTKLFEHIKNWLIAEQKRPSDDVGKFLEKLNDFDLNEYIKTIHCDELKVPSVPFQFPTSKTYFGLKDMMTSEFDFLKATVRKSGC